MSSPSMPATQRSATELFASFHLGGAELTLPVSDVQEVVNYPASVTQVPLAPAYLLGLFNLRGRLIPLVHLGQLLGLPDEAGRDLAKVAVVEFRGARVGLLFDATGEILRVREEERVTFADGEVSMIGGALKLDGGNRILQVLNVDALHGLHGMPVPKADATDDQWRQRAQQAKRRQCVSFRVNDTRLALPMASIHEIIRVPELAHSVLASELCLGRFNLRGNIVTVVDFTRFLALPAQAQDVPTEGFEDGRRVVVIRQQDTFFGMLVHEVESIVGYRDDELLAVPSFDATRPHVFTGCIVRAGLPNVILIDPAALLSDAVVAELTQGHHALYQADAAAEYGSHAARSRARETYVTFQLGRLMGMRIDQLREVIDYPADVINPPGAPAYVRGMFKLRQAMVTIVDLRALYGLDEPAERLDAKLLVVENGGEKFGLVVDGIESIVTIDVADKICVPSILRQQIDQPFRTDMREVVEMPDQGTMMLLDAAPLGARLSAQMVH